MVIVKHIKPLVCGNIVLLLGYVVSSIIFPANGVFTETLLNLLFGAANGFAVYYYMLSLENKSATPVVKPQGRET
jgi:hypothetical protein